MNLKQLSSITGYSLATVSKAFSGSNEISKETKDVIIKKAKELGIYEKYNKQKYQKMVIAILCPEIESAYYTDILSYFNKILSEKGCVATVSVTNFSASQEAELISFYSSNGKADGIIVIDAISKSKKYSEIPIVYLNANDDASEHVDCINVDFNFGIEQAINHLKENGHQKIGYIGESLTMDKYDAFIKAMNKHGLQIHPEFIVIEKNRFEDAGYNGFKKLWDKNNLPTAIFCAYDYIALGVIDFLEEKQKKVPDDLSIIGSDDIQIASYRKIDLSSIKANVKSICEISLSILLKKIKNPSYKVLQNVTVKSEFVQRNSVKNLNQN